MKTITYPIFLACFFISCNKDELMNAKPQSNLAIPSTIKDFQAMLDITGTMNIAPGFGDVSSDNYSISYTQWQGDRVQVQNMYTWKADIYDGLTGIVDWNAPYKQVFIANLVLEGLNDYPPLPADVLAWNEIKGSALFYRAFAFYNLASLFAPVYDSTTAVSDLGIPLRLKSDVNERTVRASVKQTYDQIISDLNAANLLLSNTVPVNNNNRPSKPAVLAMLSKVYLSMRNYQKAGLYADSTLKLYSVLLDYNSVSSGSVSSYSSPFTKYNPEVIFNSYQTSNTSSPSAIMIGRLSFSNQVNVDTILYNSYSSNDLRRTVYFFKYTANGAVNLKGGYSALSSGLPFSGLATNEMYLIRSECYARAGNVALAMNDLNTLLLKRWKNTSMYSNITATSAIDALNKILVERRKELPFSSVRWTDLRRLNKDGFNITLTRNLNGQIFTLPPNDPRYVLPIPPDVIQFSGIQQNIR